MKVVIPGVFFGLLVVTSMGLPADNLNNVIEANKSPLMGSCDHTEECEGEYVCDKKICKSSLGGFCKNTTECYSDLECFGFSNQCVFMSKRPSCSDQSPDFTRVFHFRKNETTGVPDIKMDQAECKCSFITKFENGQTGSNGGEWWFNGKQCTPSSFVYMILNGHDRKMW